MTDVFRVDENAPVASTSRLRLDDVDDAALPTLAQLLQETVHQAASGTGRSKNSENTQQKDGSASSSSSSILASLASLPSLSSPASRAYISSLLSKDLPSLLREPEELSKQSDVLDADLANLCFRSTGDLLGVGDCVDGVEDGFGQMQDTLDSLLSCTEQLSSSCTSFTSSIKPVLSSRSRLNLVRSNISSIEDILSIPRLVSTCVRGGWWSEAMELAYRARDLEQILRPAASPTGTSRRDLLGKVREEVEVEVKTLRARIIEGLRGRSLKLPSAVRSIGLLRKMLQTAPLSSATQGSATATTSLSEPELRLTFLASRWDCLRSQLEQIEVSADSGGSVEERVRYIKRWIEVWRELVGETVTIYNEIFLSSSTSHTALMPIAETAAPLSSSQSPDTTSLRLLQSHTPLSVFLSQALTSLHRLLVNQLQHITSVSSLASLQTQLSYCSTAFAKFGFDFRHLPNQLITSRVLQVTLSRFASASETFAKEISRAQTQSGARGGRPRIVLAALIASDARATILNLEEADLSLEGDSARPKSSQPPSYIALFPPLAKLLNAQASALNELRLLPLLSLYPAVRLSQIQELTACAEELEKLLLAIRASKPISISPNPDQERLAESEQQETIVRRMTIVFCRSVVPWSTWALQEGVYPDLHKEQDQAQKEQEGKLQGILLRLLETVGVQTEQAKPEHLTNGNGHIEETAEEQKLDSEEVLQVDATEESVDNPPQSERDEGVSVTEQSISTRASVDKVPQKEQSHVVESS